MALYDLGALVPPPTLSHKARTGYTGASARFALRAQRWRSMAYLDKVLRAGERVHFHGRLHWLIYGHGLLWLLAGVVVLLVALATNQPDLGRVLALAAIAVLVFAAWLLVAAGIRRYAAEFVVTDLRVIVKHGLLSRHTAEMNVSKIESVDVEQGILGRIFGFGTLIVRGTGASLEPLRNVADPIGMRNAILVG